MLRLAGRQHQFKNNLLKTMILSIILSFILIGLGIMHFHWAIGGGFGLTAFGFFKGVKKLISENWIPNSFRPYL